MLLYFTILYTIIIIANAAYLPPFLTPCNTQPPESLNQCIFNNIQSAKPYLIDGYPDLTFPSLRQVVITYAYVNSSEFEFGLWNYNITGFDNFHINKVEADLKNNLFKFEILLPYLEGIGSYGCKGKLFNLNLDSTGQIRANATDYILNFELKTKLVLRNGYVYLEQERRNTDIIVPDGVFYLHLDDVYLGNVEITEIINRILNSNSYYLFEVLIPVIEEKINNILGKSIDKFLRTYKYSDLFT